MSLHFDFALACDLKPNTSQQIVDTLAYMTRSSDYRFDDPPKHPYFSDDPYDSWRTMLQITPKDTHLAGEVGAILRRVHRYPYAATDQYRYTFSFRRFMLDDEFYQVWWNFSQWLAPYSETQGFVGYYREELALQPTLLYFRSGEVYLHEVTQPPYSLRHKTLWPE